MWVAVNAVEQYLKTSTEENNRYVDVLHSGISARWPRHILFRPIRAPLSECCRARAQPMPRHSAPSTGGQHALAQSSVELRAVWVRQAVLAHQDLALQALDEDVHEEVDADGVDEEDDARQGVLPHQPHRIRRRHVHSLSAAQQGQCQLLELHHRNIPQNTKACRLPPTH